MDLNQLQEIAQHERAAQKPIQIRCCVAAGCLSADSLTVKQRLEQAVVETGLGDKVQVCGVGCMRLCSQGPLVQVAESTLYEKVTPKDAPAIVATIDTDVETFHETSLHLYLSWRFDPTLFYSTNANRFRK
ncbi:MAG: hypothetical protein N4J56_001741 [Chroococcidiopsis sp. SAG 2025]|nr:(2Fe-2S) ferredoxin domain-containing protein [Chroococcidiopsis sp. SAG 2025]MDV2992087.1 hypothetical protein [Chroococcidiopsis sp. SAG 2025]